MNNTTSLPPYSLKTGDRIKVGGIRGNVEVFDVRSAGFNHTELVLLTSWGEHIYMRTADSTMYQPF